MIKKNIENNSIFGLAIYFINKIKERDRFIYI